MNPGAEFSPLGTDLFGEPVRPEGQSPLAQKFLFPPFSVLDARSGDWQTRKEAWIRLGIKSEVGREGNLLGMSDTILAGGFGKDGKVKELAEGEEAQTGAGTSIFDPVLCELAYRWWCPPGGQIIDPFSGGSVRGVVASMVGYAYWGCDLRQEQVDANAAQADELCAAPPFPRWVCGDSSLMLEEAPEADFVFSCPPYGSLEQYSEDPRDLSNMPHEKFLEMYGKIIAAACSKLRRDRFAAFVVGDFRDKRTGLYRDFVSSTIAAFRAAGLGLYNEGILMTPTGSVPMRISGQFEKSRKLGKTHQQCLVFAKGDPTIWTKPA